MFVAVSPRAFCRRTRLPTLRIARAFALVVDALTRAFVVAVERLVTEAQCARPAPSAPQASCARRLLTNDRKSSCGHCRSCRAVVPSTGASVGIGFELAQFAPPITSMSQAHPTRRAYMTLPQISKREALTLSRSKLIFRRSKASIGFMTQLSNSAGPLTSSSRTRALDWATPSSIETFKKKCVMSSTNITGTVYAIQKSPIAGWPSRALRGASGSRHQC